MFQDSRRDQVTTLRDQIATLLQFVKPITCSNFAIINKIEICTSSRQLKRYTGQRYTCHLDL